MTTLMFLIHPPRRTITREQSVTSRRCAEWPKTGRKDLEDSKEPVYKTGPYISHTATLLSRSCLQAAYWWSGYSQFDGGRRCAVTISMKSLSWRRRMMLRVGRCLKSSIVCCFSLDVFRTWLDEMWITDSMYIVDIPWILVSIFMCC